MAIVTLPAKPRRTYRGEESFFPVLEELGPRRMRDGLIASGLTPQVAGGLVWFLDDQCQLERHPLSSRTKSRYRQALRKLDPAELRRRAPRRTAAA